MFIPHTEDERKAMLGSIGKNDLEELFSVVPQKYRFPNLDLPTGLTEMEVLEQIQDLAEANNACDDLICFLGAGAYDHYVPAAIDGLLRRGEFFTAYTPYQPEISQGTLQAIFEYQSLIAHLTGMEVCNASHYDGATAAAEACITAFHNFQGKRKTFLLSPALHPDYRATIRTYLCGFEGTLIHGDEADQDPLSVPDNLISSIDENTALVLIQYPDFFGRIFDLTTLVNKAHEKGCLVAVAINPIALGLLKTPGDFGVDIVVGDGQPLGIPLAFGGPTLGIFATRKELIRKVSGRIVGESVDAQGRRGYVLTLTAREQHIRREKATSNICTNQGLMALAATIYLSLLGKQGLRKVSELCYQKAHYAAQEIDKLKGFSVNSDHPFFNEFIVKCPRSISQLNNSLLDHGFLGGFDLTPISPMLKNHMLIAITEKLSKEMIDIFCETLVEVSNE
jgi:glycine dehydrogenase subunit 1